MSHTRWFAEKMRENNIQLNLFDVGARNGILHLADLANFIHAYGFEPNPSEYKKLISSETDLLKSSGIKSPPYRSIKYFECALCNSVGSMDFYVTKGPGAAGLMPPDLNQLEKIQNKGRDFERKNYVADVFNTEEVITVETSTLDAFVKSQFLEYIDYLKIDVEGAEHEVLEGASGILPYTGVLFVEVCFIPFRKNQKLFSDVDVLLRKFGFELINYQIDQSQIGYKHLFNPTHFVPQGYADQRAQPLSADAVYVNTTLESHDRLLGQAAVLASMGYTDEALHILLKKIGYPGSAVEFLRSPNLGRGTGEKLRFKGYNLIERMIDCLGKFT